MENDIKELSSGAKSSGNLPPYECLTLTFLRRCAFRMKLGMHYGKHNWKKGAKDKEFILERLAHAVEHLHLAMSDIDNNLKETDDNLAAVAVNVMMAMEYQESRKTQASTILPGEMWTFNADVRERCQGKYQGKQCLYTKNHNSPCIYD